MKFIGIIPARGGSKGIPHKNMTFLSGKPLIDYTFDAAKASKFLDSFYVSTDSKVIADHALSLGVNVPFLRDESLSLSSVPMLPVLQDFIRKMSSFDANNDILVLLQPTSPLRNGKHIDEAIYMMRELNADTIISIEKVPHNFLPQSIYKSSGTQYQKLEIQKEAIAIRQQKPIFYARNGPAVVVTKGCVVMGGELYGKNTYGYLMDRRSSLDIDELDDLLVAEAYLKAVEK